LSAVAAGVYLIGFALLIRGSSFARRWCLLEFAGVVGIGLLSVVRSSWFPDATVWSRFGAGYGFVPLVLPLLALVWLRRRGRDARIRSDAARSGNRNAGDNPGSSAHPVEEAGWADKPRYRPTPAGPCR
jgi:hypothetical protein